MGLDKGCSTWYTSYVESDKGIRMPIQRTLIQTKTTPSNHIKYLLWQTDHYAYEIELINRTSVFRKTVPLNQMAFEEACEVFTNNWSEESFKSATTERDYLRYAVLANMDSA